MSSKRTETEQMARAPYCTCEEQTVVLADTKKIMKKKRNAAAATRQREQASQRIANCVANLSGHK